MLKKLILVNLIVILALVLAACAPAATPAPAEATEATVAEAPAASAPAARLSWEPAAASSWLADAQAKNVFWHVGSAATINGGAHMVGTIIADSGVTFPGGGATLDGRALSLVSAVSFLDTTVNVPVP